MNEMLLVLDESGAKGYSDNQEVHPGEFGVMAGFLVPASILNTVRASLETIRDRFATDGKLHITDLTSQQQGALRQAIYDYLQEAKLRWVYEAIYVQGYHEQKAIKNAMIGQAHAARRSLVKMSFRENVEMLHAELFGGVFGKALAYCVDEVGGPCQLTVVTDRTDESILKKFSEAATSLMGVADTHVLAGTGFDTTSQQVVHGTVTTTVHDPHGLLGDFSGISHTIKCEDSALTLAADVLVNGLHHHLKKRPGTATGEPLHGEAAVAGHPLQGLVYGTSNGTGFDFGDAIFRHPDLR